MMRCRTSSKVGFVVELDELIELLMQEIRNLAISRPLDLLAIEQEIRNCISKIRNDMDAVKVMLTNATADESNILSKIEKKKLDLDRRQKRLKSLQSVR